MTKEENFEEMFDLIKPNNVPGFFSAYDHQLPLISNGSRKDNTKTHVNNPSPSSFVPQLISFENSEKNITEMNYNYSNLEMAKDHYSLTPEIINFTSSTKDESEYEDSAKGMIGQKRVSTAARSPSQAQEHLMAERKRRENLSQLFINLSKVVPGLKKLDKASLLEDGITYLQALEERVRVLEEEEMMKRSSMDASNDDSSSHEERSIHNSSEMNTRLESAAPEIQARISDKHVLIKIFCKKKMDLMSRIPGEMEKIYLNVIDMRIMPFGGAALDITILAENNKKQSCFDKMQSNFEYTVKDIVDHLHTVFLNPRDNIMKDHHL